MDLGLNGKKAIITGGSRGIGRAIAETLGREGAAVAICARTEEGLQQTAREMRAMGITVHAKTLDVSDEAAIPAAWLRTTTEPRRADILAELRAGREVPGCSLARRPSLVIR